MNFEAARRMFESASAPDEPPVPTKRASAPQPQVVGINAASSVAARARSALAPAPPPVISTPSPPPPPPNRPPSSQPSHSSKPHPSQARPHHDDDSDYSELGDYSADKDFYVPGVNDTPQYSQGPPPSDQSDLDQPNRSNNTFDDDYEHDFHDDNQSDHSPDPETSGDENENQPVEVVRQHSNFSRLSAQSWLTVDSAQEVDAPDVPEVTRPPVPPVRASVPRDAPLPASHTYSAEKDHDPAKLFNVDPDADLMTEITSRDLRDMSVFECCAVLQSGVAAYKKKSFRRFGARRVWLSPSCDRLSWTSKKSGVGSNHIKLQKVAKMKCVEREVCIDVTEGYRISLLFANPDEAGLWVRALSCLIPLQAHIRAPRGIIPLDKEREDYNLTDDIFNGRPLREYMAVNSHVVLCAAKGQPQSMGNKLAFSRSDVSFCGLRYIPHKLVPLMLRSQEEIAVLKRLDHPNIVKYHECLLDTEHGGNYVVFEHLARGALTDASRLEGVKPISEPAARELIWDVLNALEYLHTLRIAHADVRPDNLLRDVNGAVKLNPLGCITHDFTEVHNTQTLVKARLGDASPAFLAPEQCWLSDAPEAHPKSYAMDSWSVSVVLYFMLYGRVPFGGRDDAGIQESICTGKIRFPRRPETSRKVRNLLKGVLGEKDPKTRIGLSELKSHPWFTEAESNTSNSAMGSSYEAVRLIVSPEEVDSAVQVAKVRIISKRK